MIYGVAANTNLQLKNPDNVVVATARDTAGSSGLKELKAQDNKGKLLLVDLDVSKVESVQAAAKKVAQLLPEGLDNLISNAGVNYNGLKTFEELYGCILLVTSCCVWRH
jgi:NAD(P)-dependent dehydrogenase (short-subunit alcohol dehydrogenase family)